MLRSTTPAAGAARTKHRHVRLPTLLVVLYLALLSPLTCALHCPIERLSPSSSSSQGAAHLFFCGEHQRDTTASTAEPEDAPTLLTTHRHDALSTASFLVLLPLLFIGLLELAPRLALPQLRLAPLAPPPQAFAR
jgi:hypothetical protein